MKSFLHISAILLITPLAGLVLQAADPIPSPTPAPGTAAATERFLELFQPFRTTHASISPDGKYLAYSVRENNKTSVVIVEIDNPGKIKTAVTLGTDEDATSMFSENDEPRPLAIAWMHWVTPTRLTVMTNQSTGVMRNPLDGSGGYAHDYYEHEPNITAGFRGGAYAYDSAPGWTSMSGVISAIDADGKNNKVLLTAVDLSREIGPAPFEPATNLNQQLQNVRPSIFDFSPKDSESLIVQARTTRSSQFCSLNVRTGKLKLLNDERIDSNFFPIFDRQHKLRGGIYGTRYSSPPFNYVLQKSGLSLGRWKNLNDVLSLSVDKGFTVTVENYFGERSIPIGFDENSDQLYYASNIGRDAYGIYSLALKTGLRTDFSLEIPGVDLIPMPVRAFTPSVLVFDRFDRSLVGIRYSGTLRTTHWFKPEFASAQIDLEARFPGQNVEIIEWNQTATRMLVLVHGVADPGSFMIYEPAKKTINDIARRASWSDDYLQHRVMTFSFDATDGHKITGLLTFPASGRFPTVPVVVRCPSQPAERSPLDFQAESMAIADMGFAVLQVDSCGAWGFGIKQRESIKNGYETVLIDDITTAVEKLSKRYRINPQRVALLGEGYGGFVALRGLQLKPDRFRCAATIEAPLDLASWMEYDHWTRQSTTLELMRSYYGDTQTLKEAPLISHPEKITKPVCLLTFPGLDGAPRTHNYLETRQFASALRRQGTPVDFNDLEKGHAEDIENVQTPTDPKSTLVELDRESVQRLPRAEAAVYRTIEYFLNAYIYDYQVKLGPLKSLSDVEN